MIDIKSSEKSFAIECRNIYKSVIGRLTLKGWDISKIERVMVYRTFKIFHIYQYNMKSIK